MSLVSLMLLEIFSSKFCEGSLWEKNRSVHCFFMVKMIDVTLSKSLMWLKSEINSGTSGNIEIQVLDLRPYLIILEIKKNLKAIKDILKSWMNKNSIKWVKNQRDHRVLLIFKKRNMDEISLFLYQWQIPVYKIIFLSTFILERLKNNKPYINAF